MTTTPYANSLFEQPWWLDVVAPGMWRESFVYGDNGQILARMPYVVKEGIIVMPSLTQTLGIWMHPDLQADYGAIKKVLISLWETLGNPKQFQQMLAPENDYVLPFRWLGCRMEPRFTYRLEDLTDCDALYQAFNKTAKKNIKYARNKVSISTETNLEALLSTLDKTFAAQGRKTPMPKDVIEKIVKTCEGNQTGKYIEARDADGHVHSCAYFVYDERVCYYLLGATDPAYRNSGAQSLVLWEGIQYASQHSKIFDFEGSLVEGIENFFRQFGGKCVPYYSITRQTMLQELMEVAKPHIKRLLGYKI